MALKGSTGQVIRLFFGNYSQVPENHEIISTALNFLFVLTSKG